MHIARRFMAVKVSQARKKFAVRYPALYADSSNKDANAFNCVQRGHQNSLEQLPHFLATFAVASLRVRHVPCSHRRGFFNQARVPLRQIELLALRVRGLHA